MFGVLPKFVAPIVLARFLGGPAAPAPAPVAPAWHGATVFIPAKAAVKKKPFELRSTRWDDARFKRLGSYVDQHRRALWPPPQSCTRPRSAAVFTGLVLVVGRELMGGGAPGGKSVLTGSIRPALTRSSVGVAMDF